MRTACPTSVGVSRESIRPGKLLPKQLATGDLLTKYKIWVAELTAQTSRAKVCLLLGAKARVEDEDENDSET